MHVRQSYSVSLCTCFGAKTLHNINSLGLCIRVYVFFILFMPPTLKKLMGHIAFGACVGACVGGSHFLYLL